MIWLIEARQALEEAIKAALPHQTSAQRVRAQEVVDALETYVDEKCIDMRAQINETGDYSPDL